MREKPPKPYPEFPLFPHASGRWAKKMRGKTHYFGKWDDPHGALCRYLTQRAQILAGNDARPKLAVAAEDGELAPKLRIGTGTRIAVRFGTEDAIR